MFDRRVTVASFPLRLGGDIGLSGRTSTSMFDMAVVFRPGDPQVIRQGLPLEAGWDVADETGRRTEGTRAATLRLYRQAGEALAE